MKRTQQYLLSMLDRLPVWDLTGDAPRNVMDSIKERIAGTDDLQPELRKLFRVRGFGEFALGLLWISDKVDRDPARVDSTEEEEKFIFSLFRKALATTGPITGGEPSPVAPAEPEPGFVPEPKPEPMSDLLGAGAPAIPEPVKPVSTAGDHPERAFSGVLEKLVEALQSASDDRADQLKDTIAKCDAMAAMDGAADELKQFCFLLQGFLHYVTDHQLIDDVRVMNIISNAQEPYSQWARLEDMERAGMLDQAIEILRDSKAMFE
jgi:hypothetical protein